MWETTQRIDNMTYKLEPGLSRITSSVQLILPTGEIKEYRDGKAATEAVIDKRWKVTELRAVGDVIEVVVEEAVVPDVNPIGEETFF